jgi:alkanesulfonate monooxygenase SsuD/methylene tetrahydromethanopterin reductase-like flavin-dependent oxidoreductase (luciferase family)
LTGATAPRLLSIALPHVEAWNTWFTRYGNTVEGFAAHNAEIDEAAERAGRDPRELERSACVFVALEGAGARQNDESVAAVPGERLAAHLDALARAGADEAILVVDPITEPSIRSLETALPSARAAR